MKLRLNFTLENDVCGALQNHKELGYTSMSAMVEAGVRRLLGEDGARPSDTMSAEDIRTLIAETVAGIVYKEVREVVNANFSENVALIKSQVQSEVYALIMTEVDIRTGHATAPEDEDLSERIAEWEAAEKAKKEVVVEPEKPAKTFKL